MNHWMNEALAPFFPPDPGRRRNWSKIPFADLAAPDGSPDPARWDAAGEDFGRFVERAGALGFNAVTLDDLAHLAPHPDQSRHVLGMIDAYRRRYAGLFEQATRAGLTPYLTTDIRFRHREQRHESSFHDWLQWLASAVGDVLDLFPSIGGLIVRIGECDGVDVRGAFQSRLAVRTIRDARLLIDSLLPPLEARGKPLVFRTWTVGAFPIGDLMWNRRTFDRVFAGYEQRRLIISMKSGESDFFRYLPVNRLFFHGGHTTLIELQARREYEGAGEFPSFIGWEHETLARQLAGRARLAGAWIWSQTGGWMGFQRRCFLPPASIWNEINLETTLRVFRDGATTEQAVAAWADARGLGAILPGLLTLLRLSHEAIRELLYIEEFARRRLYFRRVRVPPLLSVYWDRIVVTHSMRKLMRCLVLDGAAALAQGEGALAKVRAMVPLARQLGLPAEDIEFQLATFEVLALAREYYFTPFTEDLAGRLHDARRRYRAAFPDRRRYSIHLDLTHLRLPRARLRRLLRLATRNQRRYRLFDRLLMIRWLSILMPALLLRRHRIVPAFANRQAMGFRSLFR